MSKIKIKNFGPIKEGYLDDDGFMDIQKVTVFIGNQGSGKSTVAKVISTMTWIEKVLYRGDIQQRVISFDVFIKFFEYQGLKNYFLPNSYLEYSGDGYNIIYDVKEKFPLITKSSVNEYFLPRIMYVPAERNFLSVVREAFNVTGLPAPLKTFGEEVIRAQKNLGKSLLELPLKGYSYLYDELLDISYILGIDHKITLNEASSGFQSLVPLYLVSKNLSQFEFGYDKSFTGSLSIKQSIRRNEEIAELIQNQLLSPDNIALLVYAINKKYQTKRFINVVEEPEQNLFPTSQRQMLNSLLEFNNRNKNNILIMTTHSPYLINYLTLCVKANSVYALMREKRFKLSDPEMTEINEIVPMSSTVNSGELVIYEFNEKNGMIIKLADYKGLPSDENSLNNGLEDSNELFAQLLEIEQSL